MGYFEKEKSVSIRWNKHLVILYDKEKSTLICDALKKAIGASFPECDIVTVDDVGYLPAGNRIWRAKTTSFYAKRARFVVSWYSKFREKNDRSRIKEERPAISTGEPAKLSFSERRSTAISRIVNIINRFRPSIIVTTNKYSLKLTLLARKITGSDVKIVAVIPDFALSGGFVRSGVDLYMVENEMLKDALMRFGVDRDKIVISGMPFSEEQRPTNSRLEARKLLGLTGDLPLIVVNGGDYCTATIKDKVSRLIAEHGKYSLLILTYGNRSIARYYKRLAGEYEVEVLFKPTLEYPLVFAAADVIVTLPDTHFVFSAFVNKIPVVLLDGITVLEHDIFHYLVSGALVTPAKTAEETYAAVEELLLDPDRRAEMIEREQVYYLKERDASQGLLFYDLLRLGSGEQEGGG